MRFIGLAKVQIAGCCLRAEKPRGAITFGAAGLFVQPVRLLVAGNTVTVPIESRSVTWLPSHDRRNPCSVSRGAVWVVSGCGRGSYGGRSQLTCIMRMPSGEFHKS